MTTKKRKSPATYLNTMSEFLARNEGRRFFEQHGDALMDVAAAVHALEEFVRTTDEAISTGHGASTGCTCGKCRALLTEATAEGWRCDACGYAGKPIAQGCTCAEDPDNVGGAPCAPGADGSCSTHGEIVCPLCAGGAIEAVAAVRDALAQLDEVLVGG